MEHVFFFLRIYQEAHKKKTNKRIHPCSTVVLQYIIHQQTLKILRVSTGVSVADWCLADGLGVHSGRMLEGWSGK